MDIGSIFLILALAALVGLYVSRPFLERQKPALNPSNRPEEHQRSTLLAERDQVLNALQELEFDHALGKIPEEDFPAQRMQLVAHGADILRSLDALQPQAEPEEDVEARLEAAIAARRADAARSVEVAAGNGRKTSVVSSSVAAPDDDLEVILANRRRSRQDKSAGFCPQCGSPLQKSDRFCPKCGAKMI